MFIDVFRITSGMVPPRKMNDHQKGILIALFGVCCVTPDAAVIIFLTKRGVAPWTIVFWKFILASLFTGAFAVYNVGGTFKLVQMIHQAKWYHLAAILPQLAVNIGFTFSLIYTSSAHALLLINLNPLWCALLGRILLKDLLPWYSKLAMGAAMACMVIIFAPRIILHDETDDPSSSTKGYIISVATGLALATHITVIRMGSKMGYNLIASAPMGAILAALVALIVHRDSVLPGDASAWNSNTQWQFWLAMVAEGAMMGIAIVTLTIAPKFITGSEVALIFLLEVLLGPFWVWLIYKEEPSVWTLAGGLGLIVVLGLHEAMPLFLRREEKEDGVNKQSDNNGQLQLGTTDHKSCFDMDDH